LVIGEEETENLYSEGVSLSMVDIDCLLRVYLMCENFICKYLVWRGRRILPERCYELENCEICPYLYNCEYCSKAEDCKEYKK